MVQRAPNLPVLCRPRGLPLVRRSVGQEAWDSEPAIARSGKGVAGTDCLREIGAEMRAEDQIRRSVPAVLGYGMKGFLVATVVLSFSMAAYGQGQFQFNNLVPPDINARFQLDTDVGNFSSLAGNAYTVQ